MTPATEPGATGGNQPCLNCGAVAAGNYCPDCGQRKGEVRVSLRRLIADVLEDQLSINAALPRTLRALFLHPGRLTNEYIRGRVAAYIAPFRLYLVASLLFFLTLQLSGGGITVGDIEVSGGEAAAPSPASGTQAADSNQARVGAGDGARRDSTARDTTSTAERSGLQFRTSRRPFFGIRLDSAELGASRSEDWTRGVTVATGIPRLDSLTMRRIRQLGRMTPQEAMSTVGSAMLRRAPTAMFILLPVFALFLQLLYLRSRRYYVEHFVFALHYHAFAFLLFTVMQPLDETFVAPILALWLVLYLPIALHKVYGQGWLLTLFKWGVLGIAYSLVLGITLLGTIIIAVLLL